MNIFEKSGTRKNTKISFRTGEETLSQLKSICRIESRTISSLIESILTEYVLIHENNSLAEQEKRLSPRKKCSIPAVIMESKDNKKTYNNCLIKSLSFNSTQIVLKKTSDDYKIAKDFLILFNLPKSDHPLLLPCQLIRTKCFEDECMIIAKINCDTQLDSEILQNYLFKNDFIDSNDKKKSIFPCNQ